MTCSDEMIGMPERHPYDNRSGTNVVISYSEEEREENGIETEHITIHNNENGTDRVVHFHYSNGDDKLITYNDDGIKKVSYRSHED